MRRMGRNRVLEGLPWEGRPQRMLRCCEMSECQYRCTTLQGGYRRSKNTVGCYSIRIPYPPWWQGYNTLTPADPRREGGYPVLPAGLAQETCRLPQIKERAAVTSGQLTIGEEPSVDHQQFICSKPHRGPPVHHIAQLTSKKPAAGQQHQWTRELVDSLVEPVDQ